MDEDEGQTFVTIYHGRAISSARMIGVTTDPATAALVARQIIAESQAGAGGRRTVVSHLERGRRAALRQIIKNAEE